MSAFAIRATRLANHSRIGKGVWISARAPQYDQGGVLRQEGICSNDRVSRDSSADASGTKVVCFANDYGVSGRFCCSVSRLWWFFCYQSMLCKCLKCLRTFKLVVFSNLFPRILVSGWSSSSLVGRLMWNARSIVALVTSIKAQGSGRVDLCPLRAAPSTNCLNSRYTLKGRTRTKDWER